MILGEHGTGTLFQSGKRVCEVSNVRVEVVDKSCPIPHDKTYVLSAEKGPISGSFQGRFFGNMYAWMYRFGGDKSPELYYLSQTYEQGNRLPRGKCRKRYGN
jgi:hypothetical protein